MESSGPSTLRIAIDNSQSVKSSQMPWLPIP